jgi:hypothetical protein
MLSQGANNPGRRWIQIFRDAHKTEFVFTHDNPRDLDKRESELSPSRPGQAQFRWP